MYVDSLLEYRRQGCGGAVNPSANVLRPAAALGFISRRRQSLRSTCTEVGRHSTSSTTPQLIKITNRMRHNRLALSSVSVLLARRASAFTWAPGRARVAGITPSPFQRCSSSRAMSAESEATLPTIEQAAKDPFMIQLTHASEICALLGKEDDADASTLASDLLSAQLSHSDGIRGFFATYLTSEGAADKEEIPGPLMEAMENADMAILVPLACVSFGVWQVYTCGAKVLQYF